MDDSEKDIILHNREMLQWSDRNAGSFIDPYSEMSDIEKSKLIIYQQQMNEQLRVQVAKLTELIERERSEKLEFIERERRDKAELYSRITELLDKLTESQKQITELTKTNAAMVAQLGVERKNRFGSKSHKGLASRVKQEKSREQDKDDHDGTAGSVQVDPDDDRNETPKSQERTDRQKMADLLRRGTTYRTMQADNRIVHLFDASRLPSDAEIIKIVSRYAYEQTVSVTEHEYQLVTYKINGQLVTAYLPAEGDPEIIDRVEGTKASADMLAYLAFNRFALDTPLYRECQRLLEEQMRVSRMTLTNWLYKGSQFLGYVVEQIKKTALDNDAVVNCDETWCRVKVYDTYRKRYIWCLVNRKAKVAIYCYEDGSRGRDALKSIIGGAELKALQSDGYNVYLYVDKQMVDIDHVCCLAHARNKFKEAYEQDSSEDALYFLERFARLYKLESTYEAAGLTVDQITIARNNLRTKEIVGEMRSKLDAMKSPGHPPVSPLMQKALNYLDNYWKQFFNYLKSGEYSIDNNSAERAIRPLANERKNSLFFGSDKMARAAAVYHTIITTCRLKRISALDYLKKFFRAIVGGATDYTLLTPDKIGLQCNKC